MSWNCNFHFNPLMFFSQEFVSLLSPSLFFPPTRRGTSGMLPVHIAALNGHVDCVKTLLAAMIDLEIDVTDDFGRTCLHGGACSG